jgi:hypothetical protein
MRIRYATAQQQSQNAEGQQQKLNSDVTGSKTNL